MDMLTMTFPLRPHHGMCFQFYQGKGYSTSFVTHMDQLLQELQADPLTMVRMCVGADLVCGHCPHLHGKVCDSDERVLRYDRDVLKACGLHDGEEISYTSFIARIKERIILPGMRSKICGDCNWNALCAESEYNT